MNLNLFQIKTYKDFHDNNNLNFINHKIYTYQILLSIFHLYQQEYKTSYYAKLHNIRMILILDLLLEL